MHMMKLNRVEKEVVSRADGAICFAPERITGRRRARTSIVGSAWLSASLSASLFLTAGVAQAQVPFACTGEAYIVQDVDAQLTMVDQSVMPFGFVPIGQPAGIEMNNLGFRRTDGLLYALELAPDGNVQVIQIDSTGTVFGLGRPPGLPVGPRFDCGDVTPDGTTMVINSNNQNLYLLDLTSVPVLPPVTPVPVTGPSGFVFDWAVHPDTGLLYGGDGTDGQLAVLDPTTGIRSDTDIPGLPSGMAYGGAWFDASGRLFLYRNSGTIFEIDLAGPNLADTQDGPGSSRNDAAACIQDILGSAKRMTLASATLPAVVIIDYVFENWSGGEDLFDASGLDELAPVFGTEGVDWRFLSISSSPAGFANPGFNGSTDIELISQAPPQGLPRLTAAAVTVEIELLTLDHLDADGAFCNQVVMTGVNAEGILFGDLSTSGVDPDPNGDGSPDERDRSCLDGSALVDPALDLIKSGQLETGADGVASAGDEIGYTFTVTNRGNVTLTGIAVGDPEVTNLGCPGGHPLSSLAPGASATCSGSYTVTQADVDAGFKDNTATAAATGPDGNPVGATDTHSEELLQSASIELIKNGSLDLGPDEAPNPGDLITYTLDVTNTGNVTLTGVVVSDPAVLPIDCPDGQPFPPLPPGATVSCTGAYAVTQADIAAGGKTNTANVSGTGPGGTPVSDEDIHFQPIQRPPFPCIGEGFVVQNIDAQLNQVDQAALPFSFTPIGPRAGIEYNNMGFRRSDGLLYAVELSTSGNVGIVQIDFNGSVSGLGRPPGLPAEPRFDAGDVTPNGTTLYLHTAGEALYHLDLTTVPVLPAVTSVAVTGDGGLVFDWAVNPQDGRLYGGDSSDGELAVLDPSTGVRTDLAVAGLPAEAAYGAAWFDASQRLFLYQNSGAIFEIDLAGPSIVSTHIGPASERSDGAACVQDRIGAAKQMARSPGDLPATVTVEYRFENFSAAEGLFNLTAADDLAAVFGTPGTDWTFTSISSVPATLANPDFDGAADAELIRQAPAQSLPAGSTAAITVVLEVLTADRLNPSGDFCNQALVLAETPGGAVFGDRSTAGPDPDPDGDGRPSERQPACVGFQLPFECTGEAYIVQHVDAQLARVNQTVSPFALVPVGSPAGIEVNNLGFRVTDGLLYAVEVDAGGNVQIVQIDRNGVVTGLGRPPGLPAGPRFDGGDVTPDGTAMYITANNQALYRLDLTQVPVLPPVSSVAITGDRGFVFDWAVHPADGRLYGGDSSHGQLAVLDPATGVRSDVIVSGLPRNVAFGAVWFDASGRLFLYRNSGTIYEIDLAGPAVVATQEGPGSSRNDGAACIAAP